MEYLDDAEIAKKVAEGDTELFEHIVRRYEKRLFIYAGNLLPGSADTADAVQEVFIKAYGKLSTYDPGKGSLAAWLFTIARNTCFNELKKKRHVSLDEVPEPSVKDNSPGELLRKEANKRLDEALAGLKADDKELFIMAELDEMPYTEISEVMKLNIGTVRSRLSRIKEKLKAALKDLEVKD